MSASEQLVAPGESFDYELTYGNTAVAADFTGDGLVDVICNAGGMTRLLVAPDWSEVVLDGDSKLGLIHSEVIDVDQDGVLRGTI